MGRLAPVGAGGGEADEPVFTSLASGDRPRLPLWLLNIPDALSLTPGWHLRPGGDRWQAVSVTGDAGRIAGAELMAPARAAARPPTIADAASFGPPSRGAVTPADSHCTEEVSVWP